MFELVEPQKKHIKNSLLVASRDGNLEKVRDLAEQDIFKACMSEVINCQNHAGLTPLHLAIMNGHVEITAFLVNHHASLYIKTSYGATPFRQACLQVQSVNLENSQTLKSIQLLANFEKILKIFLSKGFNLNVTSSKSKSYLGELAIMDSIDAMQILLNHGADVNIRDQFGWSPLHMAAYHGRREAFLLLLANGADTHAVTNDYQNVESLVADKLKLLHDRGIDGFFSLEKRLDIITKLREILAPTKNPTDFALSEESRKTNGEIYAMTRYASL